MLGNEDPEAAISNIEKSIEGSTNMSSVFPSNAFNFGGFGGGFGGGFDFGNFDGFGDAFRMLDDDFGPSINIGKKSTSKSSKKTKSSKPKTVEKKAVAAIAPLTPFAPEVSASPAPNNFGFGDKFDNVSTGFSSHNQGFNQDFGHGVDQGYGYDQGYT